MAAVLVVTACACLPATAQATETDLSGSGRRALWPGILVPGLVQHRNEENLIAYSIMVAEGLCVGAGGVSWFMSYWEYRKYKNLPRGTLQSEFDHYIEKSNSYGTFSIACFSISGVIYLVSFIDAVCFSRSKESHKYGIHLSPDGAGLCLSARF